MIERNADQVSRTVSRSLLGVALAVQWAMVLLAVAAFGASMLTDNQEIMLSIVVFAIPAGPAVLAFLTDVYRNDQLGWLGGLAWYYAITGLIPFGASAYWIHHVRRRPA